MPVKMIGMEYDENEPFQEWTACQMYGHEFIEGTCECGEEEVRDDE